MRPSRSLYRYDQLDRLLNPASIAIIGASARPGAFGERVQANLCGYTGRLHLVNARYETLGGLPCHPTLSALPEVPDCAVICVAREAVEPVVEECIAKGVGGAIIFASGYAETGKPERAAQQAWLARRAREAGLPIIGPNCIGAVNFRLRSRITFMPHAEMAPPRPGAIGIVSQSGALGFSLEQAIRRGVPVSHVLTSGNSCDVDMADFVAFLADDPSCSTIALLFEGTSDPARLIAAAERAWAVGKPVVACKLAVGEGGAQAAMSHTGSLAGSQAAYRAAFDRAGVVMVEDFEALMEAASFFAKAERPKARGVAVLASSGGAAIMAADQAEAHGVPLPQPEAAAQAVLAARIPEFGSARNPCDVTAQVINDPESLPACANAMLDDPNFGAVLLPMVFSSPTTPARVPFYNALARRTGKAVIMAWTSEWLEGPGAAEMEADPRVILIRSMNRAFALLAAWHRREAKRGDEAKRGPARRAERLVSAAARQQAATLLDAAGKVLTEREAKAVLALYGLPVVPEALAHSADEAVRIATAQGFPAVLKVESPDLPHKTEAGVIALDLADAGAVRAAYDQVMANAARAAPDARIHGVLVQPMVPQGTEMMIGARMDPLFGPLVVVGLGGILVELLKDSAVGLAPLAEAEALDMLAGLKAQAALEGFRGKPKVDRPALAGLIRRVGEFIADHGESVAEIDINPLISDGTRLIAVDALIVKRVRAGLEGGGASSKDS